MTEREALLAIRDRAGTLQEAIDYARKGLDNPGVERGPRGSGTGPVGHPGSRELGKGPLDLEEPLPNQGTEG